MLARIISKLAGFGIHISRCQIPRGIRLLTTSSLPSYPYLLLHMDDVVGGDSPGDGSVERVVNFNYYDLVKKRRVSMEEQRIPESIDLSRNIGSSRGWMIRMNNEDLTVHVTNMLNPSVPKSARKVISLPPLVPLPYSLDPSESTPLTELVRNVSLSSSPDQEDCIVAIKFWGSCISFCRRSRSDDDSSWSWSHINSLPRHFDASSLIYSNTASIFYITPLTARTSDNSRNFEQYEHKDKHGFPLVAYFMQLGPFEPPGKLSDSELKLLLGCSGGDSRFLVETPSGDIFTIMRYMQTVKKHILFCQKESDVYELETKRFELYKHDISKGAESYVADIGDFCIFFGKNEPFCIPASVYPGLKPNSIYFAEKTHVSVYDIATHNIDQDQLPHQEHLLTPFWLPPILH